mgnify:CR=1 FL=1
MVTAFDVDTSAVLAPSVAVANATFFCLEEVTGSLEAFSGKGFLTGNIISFTRPPSS